MASSKEKNSAEKPRVRIIIVDDESSICEYLEILLRKEGYDVTSFTDPREVVPHLKQKPADLILADLMMPEMDGMALLKKIREAAPGTAYVMMTAYASVETAISALTTGASDYIQKPFKNEEVIARIKKVLDVSALTAENVELKRRLAREASFDALVGNSNKLRSTVELAKRAAASESTVLILGESGTGKELLARAIHSSSPRASGPFVSVNCAAIPETLLESELFGHTRGSFTGAVRDKEGLFKAADGGTFFLDEVGETSLGVQVKLLRVLEERVITPVGSVDEMPVDVRLIAASNADVEALVHSGRFRSDLYYRLNVIPVHVPPLRERTEDIPVLVRHFVHTVSPRVGVQEKDVDREAMKQLCTYYWPGNVRELENTLERALVVSQGDVICASDLPDSVRREAPPSIATVQPSATPDLTAVEKAYIYYVLEQTGWQKTRAAQILGIDASTLYRKIDRYGLKPGGGE